LQPGQEVFDSDLVLHGRLSDGDTDRGESVADLVNPLVFAESGESRSRSLEESAAVTSTVCSTPSKSPTDTLHFRTAHSTCYPFRRIFS